MPNEVKRKNHYAAEHYLARFAAADGRVFRYNLLVPHSSYPEWKPTSLRSTASQENLYVRATVDDDTDELERWIERDIETPGNEAIARALSSNLPDSVDWEAIGKYALLQDLRTPARFIELFPRLEQNIEQTMFQKRDQSEDHPRIKKVGNPVAATKDEKVARSVGHSFHGANVHREFPIRVETFFNDEGKGFVYTEILNGRSLWHFTLRNALTELAHKLKELNWSIVRAADGVVWPTSDDPLIRIQGFNGTNPVFGGGYHQPGVQILLPLTPTRLLYARFGVRALPFNAQLNYVSSFTVREWIVAHAHRSIFSYREEPHIGGRVVNPEQVEQERQFWSQWHSSQSANEKELMHGADFF